VCTNVCISLLLCISTDLCPYVLNKYMYNIEEKMDNKAKKFDLLFLRHFFEKKNECGGEHIFLLAHLSTKCSSWAFVMAHCLSSVRMIPGWSSNKIVQTVPVGCISRSRGQIIGFQNAILKNILVWNYKAQCFCVIYSFYRDYGKPFVQCRGHNKRWFLGVKVCLGNLLSIWLVLTTCIYLFEEKNR